MNFLLAFNLLTRVLSTNGLCHILMNYANLYCLIVKHVVNFSDIVTLTTKEKYKLIKKKRKRKI